MTSNSIHRFLCVVGLHNWKKFKRSNRNPHARQECTVCGKVVVDKYSMSLWEEKQRKHQDDVMDTTSTLYKWRPVEK